MTAALFADRSRLGRPGSPASSAGPCRRRKAPSRPGPRPQGQGSGVERDSQDQAAPPGGSRRCPNGLHLIVLEDHRLPQVSFQLIVPGAGGYFDPAGSAGARVVHRLADARRDADADVESDFGAARLDGGDAQCQRRQHLDGSDAQRHRRSAIRPSTLFELAADVLLHPSFPEEELARFKQRTRSHARPAAREPEFPRRRDVLARGVRHRTRRRASRRPSRRSIALTREQSGRVPPHPLRARSRGARRSPAICRCSRRGRWPNRKLGAWTKSAGAGDHSPSPNRRRSSGSKIYFVARPELGSDQPDRRHSGDRAHEPRLRRAAGDEQGRRRRPDRPAVPPPARGQGLHLRRVERRSTRVSTAATGRPRPTSARKSPNRRCAICSTKCGRFATIPVPDEELADAKRSMIASFALSLESPAQLLGLSVTAWRYKLPADYWDRYAGARHGGDQGTGAGGGAKISRRRSPPDRRGRRPGPGRRAR